MFNLFEMLQQSQNGAAIDAVAKQFGLTPRQAENAVDVLLPAFTLALQRQMQNPQAWPTLFSAMQPPAPAGTQSFEATGRAFAHDSMRQGANFMQSLFGPTDLSRQVAAQAAAASGLPATILQQMMPALGTMLASGMLKTFSQEGLAGVITAMQRGMPGVAASASAETPPDNPFAAYLGMMASLMGTAPAAPEPTPPPLEPEPEATSSATPLPNPFNAEEMGAYFTQMLAAATAGAMPAAAQGERGTDPAEASSPAGAEAPQPSAAQPGDDADGTPSPEGQPDNPLAVLFETGREVQDQYLRSLKELFERASPDAGRP